MVKVDDVTVPAPTVLEDLGFSSDEANRILRMGRDLVDRGDLAQAEEAVRRAVEADVAERCTMEIRLLSLRIAAGKADSDGMREGLDLLFEVAPAEERTWLYRAIQVIEAASTVPSTVRRELGNRLRAAMEAVAREGSGSASGPAMARRPKVFGPAGEDRTAGPLVMQAKALPAFDDEEGELVAMQPGSLAIFEDEPEATSAPSPPLQRSVADSEPMETDLPPVEATEAQPGAAGEHLRGPVLDVDPFGTPEAYVRPHISVGGPAARSITRPEHVVAGQARRNTGVRAPVAPVLPVQPQYEAEAEVRRQREDRMVTDADDILRRFVHEQVSGARAQGGPIPRNEAEHLYDLGTSLLAMDQYEAAKSVLDQAMQHLDFQVPASEGLLQSMVMLGENEAAQMMGRLALQAYGRNGASLIGLRYWFARAAEGQGHLRSARELYEEVVAEDDEYEDSSIRLANLDPSWQV